MFFESQRLHDSSLLQKLTSQMDKSKGANHVVPQLDRKNAEAEMLGFLLVAPPTYVFTKKSCDSAFLVNNEMETNSLGKEHMVSI